MWCDQSLLKPFLKQNFKIFTAAAEINVGAQPRPQAEGVNNIFSDQFGSQTCFYIHVSSYFSCSGECCDSVLL